MFKYFVKQFIAIPAKTPLATIVYSLCVWKKILAKNCFFNDDFFFASLMALLWNSEAREGVSLY